jgi:hypothetical protein
VVDDPGPREDPRPVALFGGGDATRMGGASRLAALLCAAAFFPGGGIDFGMAGTGGASTALGTGRAGEGSRNVRSDIDPLLPLRCSSGRGSPIVDPAVELVMDAFEVALRSILFVWSSAGFEGVVGLDRNAAAAAPAASAALDVWFLRKAWAAAVAALGFAIAPFTGCRHIVSNSWIKYGPVDCIVIECDQHNKAPVGRKEKQESRTYWIRGSSSPSIPEHVDVAAVRLSTSANQGLMRILSHLKTTMMKLRRNSFGLI